MMQTNTAKALQTAGRTAWQATVERDRLIVVARMQGTPLREIAKAAGISHTAVGKILKRETPPDS